MGEHIQVARSTDKTKNSTHSMPVVYYSILSAESQEVIVKRMIKKSPFADWGEIEPFVSPL